MAKLRWNDRSGRFIDQRGRFVSERSVRAVVDAVADHASERMAAASERLLAGEMSLGTWQAEMQRIAKDAHASAAVLAHGGAEQMTPARWGFVGRSIRDEYQFLRDFAEQISDGRQALDGRLVARSRQYGQAARVTFERTFNRDQQIRGYRFERNVLHANESCRGCRAEARRGWVPIGTLVPVGKRTCRSHCRCTLRYSRELQEAA